MSFELTYAKRAAASIEDENAMIAIKHLCKALDEANAEIRKLQTEVRNLWANNR